MRGLHGLELGSHECFTTKKQAKSLIALLTCLVPLIHVLLIGFVFYAGAQRLLKFGPHLVDGVFCVGWKGIWDGWV